MMNSNILSTAAMTPCPRKQCYFYLCQRFGKNKSNVGFFGGGGGALAQDMPI